MPRLIAIAIAITLGCGTAAAPRPTEGRTTAALPELGAHYEVSHRVRVRFDGAELGSLHARLSIEVTEARADDVSLLVRAYLLAEDRSIAAYDELLVGLDRSGRMRGPVRSRCVDPAFDELASTRLVEAILGSRPSRLEGAGPGAVITEIDEARGPAEYLREEGEANTLALRAETALSLRAARLLGVTYRGQVRAVTQHHLSTRDLLEGRSRVSLHGEVERRPGTGRGVLDVESDTEIRLTTESSEGPERCAAGFSSRQVIAMLDARRPAFRDCYEAALADDPTLHGSFRVRFVIETDGHVSSSGVVASPEAETAAWPGVFACVNEIIGGFRFAEGPPDPSTFELPLVFTPESP